MSTVGHLTAKDLQVLEFCFASFLPRKDLVNIYQVSKEFNVLTGFRPSPRMGMLVWRPITEIAFGSFIAFSLKQSNKAWQQLNLEYSRKNRIESAASVVLTLIKKQQTDNRTVASQIFEFPASGISTHYTEQRGDLGHRQITVLTSVS